MQSCKKSPFWLLMYDGITKFGMEYHGVYLQENNKKHDSIHVPYFLSKTKGGVTHVVTGNIFLIIWCKLSFRFNCFIPPINLNLIRKHLQLAVMTTLDCFNKKNRIERKNSKNWHNNIINSKIPVLIYFVLLHLLPCLSL